MAKSLGRWRTKIEKDPRVTAEHLYGVDLSLGRLEWTLYSLNLFVGLALEQTQLSRRPSREKPVGHTQSGDTCEEYHAWVPYPVPHVPIEFHPNCLYHAYISLAEIVTDSEAKYEVERWSDVQGLAAKYEELFVKVKSWPETLKSCMRMHEHATPHVIALQ